MTISLRAEDMEQTLESAYLLANSDYALPAQWIARAEQLDKSPSVAFIAAVGSVLLAKATNPNIDALVIQEREGSAGAFSLRGPAKVLGTNRLEQRPRSDQPRHANRLHSLGRRLASHHSAAQGVLPGHSAVAPGHQHTY
jgi:hypothetical protein